LLVQGKWYTTDTVVVQRSKKERGAMKEEREKKRMAVRAGRDGICSNSLEGIWALPLSANASD
jgi:hypothetical protein